MCTHSKSAYSCTHSHLNILHRCRLSRIIGLPCAHTARSLREVHQYPGACRTCLGTERDPYRDYQYRHRVPPRGRGRGGLERGWECCYCKTKWEDGNGGRCTARITWVERDERGDLVTLRGRCGHGRCVSCDCRGREVRGR